MTVISGENIIKRFNDQVLFDGLSFSIYQDDRIGLVGPNGIGKTTLFEMMAGLASVDEGSIIRSKGCSIGYIRQDISKHNEMSLFDFVCTAREDLIEARLKLGEIEGNLEQNPESEELLGKLGELQNSFETSGGYSFDSEIKLILIGLGFPENRFHNKLGIFSGGEKNRAALARILAGGDNLLLLDEPTNHLDIDSTIWLENYLRNLNHAYIVVSHDREFLGNTVTKVWEISTSKINQYYNGFEKYLVERKERISGLEHKFKHQQEEIKRIEDFIRRNMAGQKTKQAQSKQKFLARIKRIELPDADRVSPKFEMETSGRSYNLVLSIENGYFGYGHHPLLKDINFNLYRGDKVGFIGRNGSGKTTFLKTALGELESIEGDVKIGPKVDVAYFDQELRELDEKNTVINELWQLDPMTEAGAMRSFLARFGFRGEDCFKLVRFLSGGEKTKLALAKIMYNPANFLLFDEPTNHLDIDARQALEDALKRYDGAFLIVSHDRYFLNQIADKILAVEDDTLKTYPGNYDYYKAKQDELQALAAGKNTKQVDPEKQLEYAEFKKLSQQKGRLKKELLKTKNEIEKSELKLEELEKELRHNIPQSDWERLNLTSEEKSELEDKLLALYNRLEELEKLNAEYTDPER